MSDFERRVNALTLNEIERANRDAMAMQFAVALVQSSSSTDPGYVAQKAYDLADGMTRQGQKND